MALLCLAELLFFQFRGIERWLHQHIFKVGWLLTNDFRKTTLLYYIIFLPGIVLHELALWLIAGALNVRAERAIQFPEEQAIAELRLNFIRLSPKTGALKMLIINIMPLASGILALWLIGEHIFHWDSILDIAAPGTVDDIGQALSTLTSTADFWLWFYLACTIANTMFPTLPKRLSARQKTALAIALPLICLASWRIGGELNPSLAAAIEGLLSRLIWVILQITIINIGMVMVLGTIEAVIERASSKSATYQDGKLITMTRQEALARKEEMRQERGAARSTKTAKKPPTKINTIYNLKLPIPGPPGREPISRSAVAVVNLQAPPKTNSTKSKSLTSPSREPTRRKMQPPKDDRPTPDFGSFKTEDMSQKSTTERSEPTEPAPSLVPLDLSDFDDGSAPFARPFAKQEPLADEAEDWEEEAAESADTLFARPFNMSTRSPEKQEEEEELAVDSDLSETIPKLPQISDSAADKANPPTDDSADEPVAKKYEHRTRPVPKPSQRSDSSKETSSDSEEITYEPLDDMDIFADDDDEFYDDTS